MKHANCKQEETVPKVANSHFEATLTKEGVKKICAFKTVIETNCEADLPSKGRVRYICPVKGKLKKVSASI